MAPFIDKVMQDNPGVYVKSHPKGREDTPHMEVHLTTTADDGEVAEERLRRAVVQLSDLEGAIGGEVIV